MWEQGSRQFLAVQPYGANARIHEITSCLEELVESGCTRLTLDLAGVTFTCDPVTGAPGRWMVEASWGLGEAVVAGVVTPDHIIRTKNRPLVVPAPEAGKLDEFAGAVRAAGARSSPGHRNETRRSSGRVTHSTFSPGCRTRVGTARCGTCT